MKYSSRHSTDVDSVRWNNDLLKSTYSTSYQTVEYLTSNLENITPIFIHVTNTNDEIVGQVGIRIIDSTVMYASSLFKRYSKIISNIAKRILKKEKIF